MQRISDYRDLFLRLRVCLAAAVVLLVMAVIFLFSSQDVYATSGTSDAVGEFVLNLLGIEIPPGETASSVPILFGLTIRKLAHIFLYMLLGGVTFFFGAALLSLKSEHVWHDGVLAGLIAFLISFLYACLDEFHQSFVPGRGMSFLDVGIDAIGFCSVILVCVCVAVLCDRCHRMKRS